MSLGANLCGKFDATAYPTLWIDMKETETNAFNAIANTDGTLKLMSINVATYTSPKNAQPVLRSSSASNTSDGVEMFMRGTSAVLTSSTPLTLSTGLLQVGTSPKYITDSLYGGSLPDPVVRDANLKNGSTTTSGATLVSVREEFVKNSLLLASTDLYNPSSSARTSLIRLNQDTSTPLTQIEKELKSTLEQRNLKFFAAFLMEYCYYRTRYFYMLNQYFTAFQDTTRADTDYVTLADALKSPDSAIANETKKNLYMRRLAYHMARCNMIMADMRKLLNEIQSFYNGIFESVQSTIQSDKSVGSDTSVKNAVMALQSSAKELKTYTQESEFRKAAMDYNLEKNRYGSMLLALYAVLNLSALAMIYKLR